MLPQRFQLCAQPGTPGRRLPRVAGIREAGVPRPGETRHAPDTRLQLLASLNHEIRTPLSGILGMADLLLETSLDDEQAGYVAAARECAEGLFDLLNTTLEYTSLTSGGLHLDEAEFEPADLLQSAIHEARRKAEPQGITISWSGAAELPRSVVGDGYRVRQVFSLLLSTALRLTPHGSLEADAREIHDPRAETARIALVVRSNSATLSEWQVEELLESSVHGEAEFARRFSELGLSLSLLRRLVEMMGGQLTLETGAHTSCELTAELPLWRKEPVAPAEEEFAASASQDRRILVVDDNRISQRVISAILGKGQHAVDCAPDGPTAIAMAAARAYSLIFMDLQMPGMDGIQATQEIRLLPGYGKTPILALTAEVSDELRLKCRRNGMAAFLNKPVHATDLLNAVEHWMV